jgi:hypothetical protein
MEHGDIVRSLVSAVVFAAVLQAADAPTFYKDVLPVLQRKCQDCHRPGEAAPMSLLTYNEARPWAAAIREAVLTRKMPPWGADPAHGRFANDPSLTPGEIEILSKWAARRAPAGNPEDAPPARTFVDGWNIGEPDVVVQMPVPFEVPARGTLEYTRFIIPLNLTEDRWVSAAEIRPGNRAVVHHVIAYLREPDSKWLSGAPSGQPLPKRVPGKKIPDSGARENLVGYAPGVPPLKPQPGRAKLIRSGTDLVLEMHYTTNGKAATDQTKVGIVFAKEPPRERLASAAIANLKFVIPPSEPNYQVDSRYQIPRDWTLISLTPHMHLRGKDFEYRAKYPSGETEVLLRVPKYDFNWQHTYYLAQPKLLPAGTVIECTAHFDNSANNRFNPDPSVEVRWGDQSWEEMMIGFVGIVYDPKKALSDVFEKPKTTE